MTLAISGLAVLVPGQAAAAPHFSDAPPVQVGYTDSANRHTAYDVTPQQDIPLGAWRDGSGPVHVSRVYATFDVSRFAGKRIIGGTVRIQEASAADCTKRAIEIWQTKPVSRTPSWATAPEEIRELDRILTPEFCPTALIDFDVSAAVAQAAAHGKSSVTFEIRVPARQERDLSYGRRLNWFRGVGLTVQYNSPPTINNLIRRNGGFPCAGSAPFPVLGSFADRLQALANDPDEADRSNMDYEFAVWPDNDPAARTLITDTFGGTDRVSNATIPAGVLVDGLTYSWQVRVTDGADTSPWSPACSFVADFSNPAAPGVASPNYPPAAGGTAPLGEPGIFTFTATDTDTVGFEFGWDFLPVPGCEFRELGQLFCGDPFSHPGTVRANAAGGSATVTLNPGGTGRNTLLVRSIDRAGNRSSTVEYEVFVPFGGAPGISVVGGEPVWNQQVTLRLTPNPAISGTVSYDYTLNQGQRQTIAAGPDGTATIDFIASDTNGFSVEVRSRSGNGWVSPANTYRVHFPTGPGVSSDIYLSNGQPVGGVGVLGTFTFSPPVGWTAVGGYQYSFDPFAEPLFVAAGPDGRATITWAPETSGFVSLDVTAVRPDGTLGNDSNNYSFEVA